MHLYGMICHESVTQRNHRQSLRPGLHEPLMEAQKLKCKEDLAILGQLVIKIAFGASSFP